MRTGYPFRVFTPERFLHTRFAPLIPTVVEPGAASILSGGSLTFADLLAPVAQSLPEPLRIVGSDLTQTSFTEFESRLLQDMTDFAKSFVSNDFAQSGVTDPSLCPFPMFLPRNLSFDSPETAQPPWFRALLFRLQESLMFSDFDFCDFPACVLYAASPGAPALTPQEVLSSLKVPEWMAEYIEDVPVIFVVINAAGAKIGQTEAAGFHGRIVLNLPARKYEKPLSHDMLTTLYGCDREILNAKGVSDFLGMAMLGSVEKFVKELTFYIQPLMANREQELGNEFEKLSKSFFGFFRKTAAPDRRSRYRSIPHRKVVQMWHASLQLVLRKYGEAQRAFRSVAQDLAELPGVKSRAFLFATLSILGNPSAKDREFANGTADLIKHCAQAGDPRFMLLVPLLLFEIEIARGEAPVAARWYRDGLGLMDRYPANSRAVVLGILRERLAGLSAGRHRALTFMAAGSEYVASGQLGHALRAAIWIMQMLPGRSWDFLKQRSWLEQAVVLQELGLDERALLTCKDLLSLPNLVPDLHEKVITQFWAPFNSPGFSAAHLNLEMSSLVDVKKVVLYDLGEPQFYEFGKDDFAQIEKAYSVWFHVNVPSLRVRTLSDYWGTSSRKVGPVQRTVPCNQPVKVLITILNRYRFSVHLQDPTLDIHFENEGAVHSELSQIKSVDIPPNKRKGAVLSYSFVPKCPGTFTISGFSKNYWGYIDTTIAIGPLVLTAVSDLPMMEIRVCDLPKAAFQDSCYEFSLNLANVGTVPTEDVRVVFDQPNSVQHRGEGTVFLDNNFQMVLVKETIQVSENLTVPMVFRAPAASAIVLHFLVDIAGRRVAFAMQRVALTPAIVLQSSAFPKLNDAANYVIQCNIRAEVDKVQLVGIVNSTGRFLRMIESEGPTVLMKGENRPLIAFAAETIEGTIDPWRQNWMEDNQMDLMYRVGNQAMLSQRRLDLNLRETDGHFKVTMPAAWEGKIGDCVDCDISMQEPRFPIYVEPQPFQFIDRSIRKYNGLRWVGKTRAKLCDENGYHGRFSFMILGSGIYRVSGLSTSQDPEFGKPKIVSFSQLICISLTK
jgi:hypothetical protein